MKFIIKTSAVGISDKKFAPRGEYETEDKKEIDRLREIAKKFPDDIEEVKGKAEAPKQTAPAKKEDDKKDTDQTPTDPETPADPAPQGDPKKTDTKPAAHSKK